MLKGYVANGRVYGYTNVPIEDLSRKGLYGRPYVEAVRLEINPEEAAVVVRIFELYVGGLGCRAIAKKLNEEGVRSPLKGQSASRRLWNTFAVSGLLTNEKFRGVYVWNRTKVVRNPRTHRKEQRPRPQSEWERVDVPGWRIVSEEQWNAAVEANQRRRGPSWRKVGGLNRSEAARQYIFSGVMSCAECGGTFNVVGGKGQSARYGCIGHRYRGTCTNKLTIRRDVLEARLLQALSRNVLEAGVRDRLSREFREQLVAAWKDRASRAQQVESSVKSLRGKQEMLRQQAENLLDAIAATNGSSLVYERLSSIEAQMRSIDQLLATQVEVRAALPSEDDLRKFLERKLANVAALFAGDPELAKQRILTHVGKLVMGPMYPAQGPTYEVSGDVRLFAARDHGNAAPGLPRTAGPVLLTGKVRNSVAA